LFKRGYQEIFFLIVLLFQRDGQEDDERERERERD